MPEPGPPRLDPGERELLDGRWPASASLDGLTRIAAAVEADARELLWRATGG